MQKVNNTVYQLIAIMRYSQGTKNDIKIIKNARFI